MGHYVDVEKNVQLFVEDLGEGQPVVFIHGWPVNHKMFEYQMNELPKKGYRFIGIDLRGYGKSDKPFGPYDYNTKADDVKKVIDALGLDDVILGGFSMGGPIAIRYMARHNSHKVSKLVLMAPAAPVFTQRDDYPHGLEKSGVDDIISNLQSDRPAMLEEFGKMFFASEVSDAYAHHFHSLGMEASSYATIHSAEALRDEDVRGNLSSINVPTLSLHGRKDEICPFDFSLELEKSISDFTLVPFENSGHGLFFEEKEKFNQELLSFFSK